MNTSKINVLSLTLFLSLCMVLFSCKKDEIQDKEQFLGTYSVNEVCSTDSYSYTMSITDGNSANEIVIANFGDFQQQVKAEIEGRFFSVPDQTINNNSGIISITSGLGEISGNTLTITYSYSIDGGEIEICSKTCSKI